MVCVSHQSCFRAFLICWFARQVIRMEIQLARGNGLGGSIHGWNSRSVWSELPQVLVEPFEGARPCQFGSGFVITRSRVVVEAMLFAVVHV